MTHEDDRIQTLIEKVADAAATRTANKFDNVDHPRPECLLEWGNMISPLTRKLDSIDNRLSNIELYIKKTEDHDRRLTDLERYNIKNIENRLIAIELLREKITWASRVMWTIVFGGGGVIIYQIVEFIQKVNP